MGQAEATPLNGRDRSIGGALLFGSTTTTFGLASLVDNDDAQRSLRPISLPGRPLVKGLRRRCSLSTRTIKPRNGASPLGASLILAHGGELARRASLAPTVDPIDFVSGHRQREPTSTFRHCTTRSLEELHRTSECVVVVSVCRLERASRQSNWLVVVLLLLSSSLLLARC